MVEYTSLQVRKETKGRLATMRRGGESYDALVRRLMNEASRHEEEEFLAELDAMYEDDDAFAPME